MTNYHTTFSIDGTEWSAAHIERVAYERNLHVLQQLNSHGLPAILNGKALTNEDVDFLTMAEAWQASIETRAHYHGKQIHKAYEQSFARSDQMWQQLGFSQEKPMRVSHCTMVVDGVTLPQFMDIMRRMQSDERLGLAIHPEHFAELIDDQGQIFGIEPFGMYGTPTLVTVKPVAADRLSQQILVDRDTDYQSSMAGLCYLSDGVTPVNVPYHQFQALENGFQAKLAVYWPAGVPDELVSGHALHLATEFHYGLKMIAES